MERMGELALILTFSPGEKEQQIGVLDFPERVRWIQSMVIP